MDAETFLDSVSDEEYTAIERLGSDKALIAATDATLETAVVLRVVAATEQALHETTTEWAEMAENTAARDLFERVAAAAANRAEAVVAELDDETVPPAETFPAADVAVADDVERVAALVGQAVVTQRTLLQAVNFFVNEADERRASLLRDQRSAASDRADDGAATLESLCADDGDWERAVDTACDVVDAAYGTYVSRLEEMGVDPKPIC
jgi:hypothetical protein